MQTPAHSAAELAQTAEDALKRLPGAVMVPIERIRPNDDNPRQQLVGASDQGLVELADSIAERGLLHPLVVRRDESHLGHYQVIAGSRRLLAAHLLQASTDEALRARVTALPCIIKETTDRDAFADALLENLARADLSRIEIMDALHRLAHDYGWSGKEIARRTGRSQGDVSELLRIAEHPEVAALIHSGQLRPSSATIILRMPVAARTAVLDEIARGTTLNVEEIKARYRTATGRAQPSPTVYAARVREMGSPAQEQEPQHRTGVSNSIPLDLNAVKDAEDGHVHRGARPQKLALSIETLTQQLAQVGDLLSLVQEETAQGQAVLRALHTVK